MLPAYRLLQQHLWDPSVQLHPYCLAHPSRLLRRWGRLHPRGQPNPALQLHRSRLLPPSGQSGPFYHWFPRHLSGLWDQLGPSRHSCPVHPSGQSDPWLHSCRVRQWDPAAQSLLWVPSDQKGRSSQSGLLQDPSDQSARECPGNPLARSPLLHRLRPEFPGGQAHPAGQEAPEFPSVPADLSGRWGQLAPGGSSTGSWACRILGKWAVYYKDKDSLFFAPFLIFMNCVHILRLSLASLYYILSNALL